MRTLAEEFGVSLQTVHRAASILRNRGILRFRERSGMRIAGRKGPGETPRRNESSHDKLVAKLRKSLEQGELRAGTRLPKSISIAEEHGVSGKTVSAALKTLESCHLVHKSGRYWIAGPAVMSPSPGSPSPRGTVLLVLPDVSTWLMLRFDRYEQFTSRFFNEADLYNISTLSCFTRFTDRVPAGAKWVGKEAVRALIQKLDTRYLGAVIFGIPDRPWEVIDWLEFLCRFDKPVVWSELSDLNISTRPIHKKITHCCVREERAVDLAVAHLGHYGHTQVGAWKAADGNHWITKRFEMIVSAAGARDICVHEYEFPFKKDDKSTKAEANSHYTSKSVRKMVAQISEGSCATAFLLPHDYTAFQVYNELANAGIEPPGDVSLVSFDNHHRIKMLPVDSIDFGFGYLGYCAFHTIFGVIRIQRSANGDIVAKPKVVVRGSVDAPDRRRPYA